MSAKRRWPRDADRERFWRGMLRQHRRSGTTVRDFCAAENLRESAFYFWRREIERRNRERRESTRTRRSPPSTRSCVAGPESVVKGSGTAAQPGVFLPVEITPPGPGPSPPRLDVVLPSGAMLHVPAGFDRATLASVVDVLEARGC